MTFDIRSTHALALLTGIGLASAAMAVGAGGGNGKIHACVSKKSATVKIKGNCNERERPLTWNVKGPAGATGATGAAGTPGAKGDKGDTGNGNGLLLRDANNAVIGHVVSTTGGFVGALPGWTIFTLKGYSASVNALGAVDNEAFYFSSLGCTGTVYVGAFAAGATILAKALFGTSSGRLRTLTGGDANGVATAAGNVPVQSSQSGGKCTDNPMNVAAWSTTEISAADAGLPATIAAPLRIDAR
jgi:hypothetical protein